jgi:hypothetical protein
MPLGLTVLIVSLWKFKEAAGKASDRSSQGKRMYQRRRGDRVVPGERGQRRREALLERGTLLLSRESWDQLVKAGEAVDLTPPEL